MEDTVQKRKFVYHGTNHYDWLLIDRDGLRPQEPMDGWDDNWPGADTREPRLFGTNRLLVAKTHCDYPNGVVLRVLADNQWNVGYENQILWRTTSIPRSEIEVLQPNGKWRK